MNVKLLYSIFFVLLFWGCNRKEQEILLDVQFAFKVLNNNYSVPVTIQFSNETRGANNYKWYFEGGSPAEYSQKEPGQIVFKKPGRIRVSLEASNSREKKVLDTFIVLDSAVKASFIPSVVINDFAPAQFKMINNSDGANFFTWQFSGASVISSVTEKEPIVKYDLPGTYLIKLEVKNNKGVTDTISKQVSIRPALNASFEIIPSFNDDDMEAPLKAVLSNHTISATSHRWYCNGGILSSNTDSIPILQLDNPGVYSVEYIASNGKQSDTITKTIVVKPNSYLRTFQNITLGINTAQNTLGSYFSTISRKVYKSSEINVSNGNLIDVVFFGLNENWVYNKFISPDSVSNFTFTAIPNALHTSIVNKQENCSCGLNFTVQDFDGLTNGNILSSLNIIESLAGQSAFNNTVLPRVVLFKNAYGKIGAIKVKQMIANGSQSYIIIDVKVQKD